jgi:hypothetical protein
MDTKDGNVTDPVFMGALKDFDLVFPDGTRKRFSKGQTFWGSRDTYDILVRDNRVSNLMPRRCALFIKELTRLGKFRL